MPASRCPRCSGSNSRSFPKGAKNADAAKDFLRYLIQPANLGDYLKEAKGRWLPVMPSIVHNDPYWLDPKDPHRAPAVRQGVLGPTMTWFYVFNPAYAQVRCRTRLRGRGIRHHQRHGAGPGDRQGFARIEADLRGLSDSRIRPEQPHGCHRSASRPSRARRLRAVRRGDASGAAARKAPTSTGHSPSWCPISAVFLLFVVYPVGYGLWLGHHPASYRAVVRRSDLSAHRGQHADLSRRSA